MRLRDDANLNYLYTGKQKSGRGRPKQYDGKVDMNTIDKRRFKKTYSDSEIIIYGARVYSISLKRIIKAAYTEFLDENGKVCVTKMFFTTDIDMDAYDVIRHYRSRYQIEYLYRDSKQFTGLEHCQARDEQKLHFHFNTCLTAVSIGKVLLRNQGENDKTMRLSISDIKTELRNRNMVCRIFSMYGLDQNLIKKQPTYSKLLNFGKIAA